MKPNDNLVVSSTEPQELNRKKVWIQKGKNRFNKNTVMKNYYLNKSGELIANACWCITDFIEVRANTEYVYQGLTIAGTAPYSAYYDEDKNFISSFKQTTGSNLIIIPSNACYVRFSICLNDTQTGEIFDDINTFQFEQNSTATEYEEYIEPKIYVKNNNDVYEYFISKDDTLERYSTGGESAGVIANVVDNLESTSKTDALSANQGKILNERIIGTILYKDETGTTEVITLNTAIENFTYFEIESYVIYNGSKVYRNTGKLPINAKDRVHLINMFIGLNNDLQVFCKRVAINGNDLTINSDRCWKSNSPFESEGTYTYITKITGYEN